MNDALLVTVYEILNKHKRCPVYIYHTVGKINRFIQIVYRKVSFKQDNHPSKLTLNTVVVNIT